MKQKSPEMNPYISINWLSTMAKDCWINTCWRMTLGCWFFHLFELLVGFILLILDWFSLIMFCFIIVLRVIPCSSGLPGTCNPPVSALPLHQYWNFKLVLPYPLKSKSFFPQIPFKSWENQSPRRSTHSEALLSQDKAFSSSSGMLVSLQPPLLAIHFKCPVVFPLILCL